MKLILDSSFLIELKKGNKRALKALKEREKSCEDLLISSITVYELMVGAYYLWKKHNDVREFVIIEDMLKPLTKIPVTEEIAKKAAEVKAALKLEGAEVPDVDVLIACSDEGEILTFDREFEGLKGLGFNVTVL